MIGWLLKIAGGLSGRLWGALALAGVLAAAGAWAWHSVYDRGYQRGSADVRQEWGADVAKRERAWRGEIDRQQKITREVERGLTEKLDAADARGRGLADRLLSYQRALAVARAAAAAAAAGQADGTAGEPEGEGGAGAPVDDATREYFAACERDATKLAELQGWVGKIIRDPMPE